MNEPFDVQMYLLNLVDYVYISNDQATGSSPGGRAFQNFSSFGIVVKTNMADATLETRGVKGTGNVTRNSFTSFERTRTSRRKPSSVSRSARDVMVWFVHTHHAIGEKSFQLGASYELVTTTVVVLAYMILKL